MTTEIRVPGVGNERAPLGSQEWAQRLRLRMQAIVNHVEHEPESLRLAVEACEKHRAWTMLDKSDGSRFASWEEFCSTPQPWGLGKPWPELRPYVEAVAGKQAVQLVTVAPAATGNQHTAKGTGRPKQSSRKDKAIRAILRAPVEVQELYREGLISQKLAAKLGPKNPAKAKPREEVAKTIGSVARDRKSIDEAVRSLLGQRKPSRVEQAVKLVAQMSGAELKRFFEAVEQYR